MSLKRIFSLLTVALSVAVVGFAQDAKPETATPEKAEKRMMKGMKRDGVKRDGMKRGGRGHFWLATRWYARSAWNRAERCSKGPDKGDSRE